MNINPDQRTVPPVNSSINKEQPYIQVTDVPPRALTRYVTEDETLEEVPGTPGEDVETNTGPVYDQSECNNVGTRCSQAVPAIRDK